MSWKISAILLIGAALFLMPGGLTGLDVYDEGIRVHGAQRVYAGDVPYRDFYAIYGPATFYWTAGLFKIFGVQLLVFRLSLILFNALAATAIFAFCRKMNVGTPGALLAYVIFLLPRSQYSYDLLACDPSVPLILWAGVLLVDGTSRRAAVLPGLLLGFAALFRQDFGTYGTVAALAACALRERTGLVSDRVRQILAEAGWLVLGVTLTGGLGYGMLALQDWRALLTNLVTYPARVTFYRRRHYSLLAIWWEFRAISWTFSRSTLLQLFRLAVGAMPILLAVAGLPLVIASLVRRFIPTGKRAGFAFLIFLVPGFVVYGMGRSDWPHLFPLYTLAVPLLTVLVHWFWKGFLKHVSAPRAYRWGAAAACALAVLVWAGGMHDYLNAAPLPFERTHGIVSDGDDYDWLVDTVKDLSSETGSIFVAGERHDRVFINAMMVYFLSRRPSAVYFEQFDPGLTTTGQAQAKIISDLEQNRVETVFVWRNKLPNEPNLSSTSSGVKLLDSYLTDSYEQVKSGKLYSILKRRS
jgi:hypothetical protein